MTDRQVIGILQDKEAILKGHFLLSSGLHSDTYIQCAKVLQYPKIAERLAKELAELFENKNIDVVVSPAVGGIILGYLVAKVLGKRMIFTEREKSLHKKRRKMVLRREFSIRPGEKVLIVEDVVTTARSVGEVIELIKQSKGGVAGIACLIDRGDEKVIDAEIYSLATFKVNTYKESECPMCKRNIPLYSPGSSRQI